MNIKGNWLKFSGSEVFKCVHLHSFNWNHLSVHPDLSRPILARPSSENLSGSKGLHSVRSDAPWALTKALYLGPWLARCCQNYKETMTPPSVPRKGRRSQETVMKTNKNLDCAFVKKCTCFHRSKNWRWWCLGPSCPFSDPLSRWIGSGSKALL